MEIWLDLLPDHFRKRQCIRRRLRLWGSLAAALAMAGCLHSLSLWRQNQVQLQDLAAVEQNLAPLRALEKEIDVAAQRLKKLQAEQPLTYGLASRPKATTLLGLIARASRAAGSRASLQRLQWNRTHQLDSDTTKGSSAGDYLAALQGAAADHPAVARFVAALREANAFVEVRLTSTEETEVNGHSAVKFFIECYF